MKASGSKVPGNRQRRSSKMRLEEKELEEIVKLMEKKMENMRAENVRMRKLEKKSNVKLKKIEKKYDKLRKLKKQLLDKCAWAQTYTDVVQGILNAEDEDEYFRADLLTNVLRELIMMKP